MWRDSYKMCVLVSYWKKHKINYITLLFQFLHWLPIQQRIEYKINILCDKCITLPYSLLCVWYSQPPDSSHQTLHCWFPRLFCFHSLYMEWPPLPLGRKPSLDSFTCNIKTFLFPKLYTCHVFCSMLPSSSVSSLPLLPVLSCVN